MGRWVGFDEDTTAMLAQQTGVAAEFQRGDALRAAIRGRNNSVVLLPGEAGQALLITVMHMVPDRPMEYVATGFLGLMDEPVYDEEPQPPKKWWQKLLG